MAQAVAIGLMATATAVKARSQYQQGKDKAAVAEANASISRIQAGQVQAAGDYEVARLRYHKAKTEGTQRATYGKSGVRLDEGSPIEVMADTAAQYEMDIKAQKYNTAVEYNKYKYQADVQSSMAKRYKRQGYMGAFSTLLQGGAMMAGMGAGGAGGGSSVGIGGGSSGSTSFGGQPLNI